MPETGFVLDPRLAASTLPLLDLPLCSVFLNDDARFPWLVMVPRRADIAEILDLTEADRRQLFEEITLVSGAMRRVSAPDKLNIGALGNIVRQLHVHVVGRFQSDAAWPGPVWGNGTPMPYPAHVAGPLMDRFAKALSA